MVCAARRRPASWLSVGVDLAAVPTRPTGLAALTYGGHVDHAVGYSDEDVAGFVLGHRPRVVVVDAPLSLPLGRTSLDAVGGPHLRRCDRELLKRGIRVFPLTLGPMRKLTERGMALAAKLRRMGFRVFEGYPGGAQDVLGVPRKGRGVGALAEGLRRLGLRVDVWTHDELDAATCAYVGLLYLQGAAELVGDKREGEMLLPLRV